MTQNLYKTHTAICKFGTLININKGELNRGQLKRDTTRLNKITKLQKYHKRY